VERRTALLAHVKTVFVLGAGAGYHLAELARQTNARLVVIEHSAELAQAVGEIHGFQPPKLHFECFTTASHLRANERVRDSVKRSFVVLSHAPSRSLQPGFYTECERQLLARDWGNLTWQWQLKGHAALDGQVKLGADDGPALTIYDLDGTELSQNSEERERMLIKALRELVK
jgi:hypothetical protein